jgi:type IV secretory pathway TrbD component
VTNPEEKKLMRNAVIQSALCVLITLWGIAMVIIGMVWENWTWALLGVAVLIVGLPFVRNAVRSTPLQNE